MRRIYLSLFIFSLSAQAVKTSVKTKDKKAVEKVAKIDFEKIAAKFKKNIPSSEAEIKKKLTPEQYSVTRKEGTEPPFHNEYYNNKKEGIYVDALSGEPLFSSKDKYDSGTGWPSFTQPLFPKAVAYKEDHSYGTRTEVRSAMANSHLGHVFDDGPEPTGKRFCMNSASLRFIPKEKLQAEGYGEFLVLFNP